MTVNPDKFQAMIMSCDKKENKYDLNINNSIMSPAYPLTFRYWNRQQIKF